MPDREKVINSVDICLGNGHCADCHYCLGRAGITTMDCRKYLLTDVLTLLKEQKNLLGIQQTADSITFISTGTAQQGEERGIMLGKSWMNEWLKKELLHRGLLTDDIRAVFDEAKRQEWR